jgi:hypothetical protein
MEGVESARCPEGGGIRPRMLDHGVVKMELRGRLFHRTSVTREDVKTSIERSSGAVVLVSPVRERVVEEREAERTREGVMITADGRCQYHGQDITMNKSRVRWPFK